MSMALLRENGTKSQLMTNPQTLKVNKIIALKSHFNKVVVSMAELRENGFMSQLIIKCLMTLKVNNEH